jgi:phosphate transport system permease protein
MIQWGIIGVTVACTVLALVPLVSLIVTSIQNGGAAVVQPTFYTSAPPVGCNSRPGVSCSLGGIGPQIQGTLIVLAIGALVAVPVGLLAGIYLSEYGRNRFARSVSFLADVMTGIPTIIIAVVVSLAFLSVAHDVTLSAVAVGAGLGVLMIPITVRTTEESLKTVPVHLRESALALGFPRHRVALRVVLGSAQGGIVTGLLLAASRAIGDTAIPLLLGGTVTSFWYTGLGQQVAVMTPFIFNNFGSPYQNLQTDAWGASLVLLGIMLVISLGARLAVRGTADAAEVG